MNSLVWLCMIRSVLCTRLFPAKCQRSIDKRLRPPKRHEASPSSRERDGRGIDSHLDVPQRLPYPLTSSVASMKDLWAESRSQSLQRSGRIGFPKAQSSPVPSSTLSLQERNWFQWLLARFQACVSPSYLAIIFHSCAVLDTPPISSLMCKDLCCECNPCWLPGTDCFQDGPERHEGLDRNKRECPSGGKRQGEGKDLPGFVQRQPWGPGARGRGHGHSRRAPDSQDPSFRAGYHEEIGDVEGIYGLGIRQQAQIDVLETTVTNLAFRKDQEMAKLQDENDAYQANVRQFMLEREELERQRASMDDTRTVMQSKMEKQRRWRSVEQSKNSRINQILGSNRSGKSSRTRYKPWRPRRMDLKTPPRNSRRRTYRPRRT